MIEPLPYTGKLLMVITLGLLASIGVVALAFSIRRQSIVIVSLILALLTMTQYALLDKWTTVTLGAITLVYGIIIAFESTFPILKSRWTLTMLSIFYTVTFFLMNGININMDILAYTASLTGVLIMGMSNPIAAKWVMLINGITWSAYQVFSGAYGQLPGELFYTAGVIITLVLLYKTQSRGDSLDSVPEIGTILIRKFKQGTSEKFSKILSPAG